MDDKTAVLIEKLAGKLGTTAEHLWGVLVAQAPISGALNLMISFALVFATWRFFRFVKRKTSRTLHTPAEWEYEQAEWAWAVATLLITVSVLWVIIAAEGIAAAFLNPEYWALKQVIK